MNKIQLIQTVEANQSELLVNLNIRQDIYRDLGLIVDNSPYDWHKLLFAALQYTRIQNYQMAETLLIRNIDNGKEKALNLRILGEVYALSDQEKLSHIITRIAGEPQARFFDALYLMGYIQNPQVLQAILNDILKSAIDLRFEIYTHKDYPWNPFDGGRHILLIDLPENWWRYAPENFTITAHFPAEEKLYYPTAGRTIIPELGRFAFDGLIQLNPILQNTALQVLILKLFDGVQSVDIRLGIEVENSRITRLVVKEIKTGNACYGIEDSSIEKLAECSF